MSRLIDADAIPYRNYLGDDEPRVYRSQIEAMPTIDPVKHAWWEYPLGLAWNYVCSECGGNGGVIGTPYCPSCGAKMDGDAHG